MKILIADDEQIQREMMKGFLEKQGYEVAAAKNGKDALDTFHNDYFRLVLVDHKMPDMTGDLLIEKIKEINPLTRCMMITAYGSVDTAIRVMKLGSDDLLEKPVDLNRLLERIREIEHELYIEDDIDFVGKNLPDFQEGRLPVTIIGKSPAMKSVLSLAGRAASTDWTVLVTGESGTGKELIARLIHLLGSRADQPFIEVNCAAIPENLFESELFGHEKGAFTGAVAAKRGQFEIAKGGTLFLDEVGELPLHLQPKLLRAIQEKKVNRVGSGKQIETDVRIIAATNRSLKEQVESGNFREDLYFRLNVLDIHIPPLNRRKQDIPDLIDYFMSRYSPPDTRLHPDTLDSLIRYPFPGNIRELEHIIQRTTAFSRGPVILPTDLPAEIRLGTTETTGGSLEHRLEAVEKQMLIRALEENDGVQTKAAEVLGISERVLRYKLKKHNVKNKFR